MADASNCMGGSEPTEDAKNFSMGPLYYRVHHSLWLYWCPVLIFGGTLTNGLSLLVFRHPDLRPTTMAFSLSVLALSDLGVLYTGALRRWLQVLEPGLDYVSSSLVSCRIFYFFTYLFPQVSSWTIVLVTAERLVWVRYPFRAKVLCTRKRIAVVWTFIVIILAGSNSHFLWNLVVTNSGTRTTGRCQLKDDALELFVYWMDFVMLAALPCLLIAVSNCYIVFTMGARNRRSRSGQRSRRALQQQRSLTATALIVSFAFLVTTLPVTVYFIAAERVMENNRHTVAKLSIAYAVCNLLFYTGSAINFFLYVLTAQRFRAALLKQLSSCPRKPSIFNRENRMDAGDAGQAGSLCPERTSLRNNGRLAH